MPEAKEREKTLMFVQKVEAATPEDIRMFILHAQSIDTDHAKQPEKLEQLLSNLQQLVQSNNNGFYLDWRPISIMRMLFQRALLSQTEPYSPWLLTEPCQLIFDKMGINEKTSGYLFETETTLSNDLFSTKNNG